MYVTQHVQQMCAIFTVGIALTGIGLKYALQLVAGLAAVNQHLEDLNGTVVRHEELIAGNSQAISDTIERIAECRQRQEDRVWVDMAEFRTAVQEDIQTALDRWNVRFHQQSGG